MKKDSIQSLKELAGIQDNCNCFTFENIVHSFNRGRQSVKPGGSLGPDRLERAATSTGPGSTVSFGNSSQPNKNYNKTKDLLNPRLSKQLVPYQNALFNVVNNPELMAEFQEFMKRAGSRQYKRVNNTQ